MSGISPEEVGSILEDNITDWISVIGIFLIVGVALFNFTDLGKTFSISAYIIALVLITILLADYLAERNRLKNKGFQIRPALDLLAGAMVGVWVLVAWIIYVAWTTHPKTGFSFPLSFIAGEIGIVAEKVAEEIVKHPDLVLQLQSKS